MSNKELFTNQREYEQLKNEDYEKHTFYNINGLSPVNGANRNTRRRDNAGTKRAINNKQNRITE